MAKRVNKADALVGRRARAFRLQARLSQTEVGDALGISFQQVQKYEKGTNRISASKLAEMAKLFKVTPGSFFTNGEPATEDTIDVGMINNRGRARLMRLLDEIDDQRYDNKIADMVEFHLATMNSRSKTRR